MHRRQSPLPEVYSPPGEGRHMAKRIFVALTIGIFCAAAGPAARAQAVAESAIMHANSGISGSVARALGGNIQQGLSKTQGRFLIRLGPVAAPGMRSLTGVRSE